MTRDVGRVADREFDLLVVGGGIIGLGIARDAALRGLRVALLEQEDWCSGTSSRSTRLIHGGLRYLAMADFRLVRVDLRERELLLRLAPHLVRPLLHLIPIYGASPAYRATLQTGLLLYDMLSYDKSLPSHRFLSAADALEREPRLERRRLRGALVYSDAQVPSVERLGVENAVDAELHGASLLNHARVTAFVRQDDAVVGVRALDALSGGAFEVRAKVTINATGPWLDRVLQPVRPDRPPLLRTTKGVHLVVPATLQHAIVLFPKFGRILFAIPWLGQTLIGTTDTDFHDDPSQARADERDVAYLASTVERALPDLPLDRIAYTWAGVRALARRDGVSATRVSRKHRLLDHAREGAPGLISVVGGKITAYRAIAEEAVNLALKRLGRKKAPAATDRLPLPGARGGDPAAVQRDARVAAVTLGLDPSVGDHLAAVYGSRYREVLELVRQQPELGRPLHPDHPELAAEAVHAAEREGAATLADFLLRRSLLGLRADQGLAAAEAAARALAPVLGWDEARVAREVADYRAAVAAMRCWQGEGAAEVGAGGAP